MKSLHKLKEKQYRLSGKLERLEHVKFREGEASYTGYLAADEFDKIVKKLKKVEEKLESALKHPFDENKERWRADSEELDALHRNLDDCDIPRYENNEELSSWGRVLRMQDVIKKS
jgi:uncharacterized phage-like protein YoqJ